MENKRIKKLEKSQERFEYASKQFTKNKIKFIVITPSRSFALLDSNNKQVMFFDAYTGRVNIPKIGYRGHVGIKNCIKNYNLYFRKDK